MVWNIKKKLLFIHVPKTGGSSVEEAMNCYRIRENGYKIIDNKAIQHSKWNYYKNIEPKVCIDSNKSWNIFSVVRDPFQKIISEFYFLKKKNLTNIRYEKMYFKNINHMTIDNFIDYAEHIVKNKLYHLDLYNDHFMPQSDYIYDDKDNLKVNNLFYFYQIKNGDVLRYLNKFGIKELKHREFNGKYDEIKKNVVLNKYQKKKIRRIYSRDFRLLFK